METGQISPWPVPSVPTNLPFTSYRDQLIRFVLPGFHGPLPTALGLKEEEAVHSVLRAIAGFATLLDMCGSTWL